MVRYAVSVLVSCSRWDFTPLPWGEKGGSAALTLSMSMPFGEPWGVSIVGPDWYSKPPFCWCFALCQFFVLFPGRSWRRRGWSECSPSVIFRRPGNWGGTSPPRHRRRSTVPWRQWTSMNPVKSLQPNLTVRKKASIPCWISPGVADRWYLVGENPTGQQATPITKSQQYWIHCQAPGPCRIVLYFRNFPTECLKRGGGGGNSENERSRSICSV